MDYKLIFDNLISLHKQHINVFQALTNCSVHYIYHIFGYYEDPITTNLNLIESQILKNYIWEKFSIPELSDYIWEAIDNYFDNCYCSEKIFSLEDLDLIIINGLENEANTFYKDIGESENA